MKKIFLLALVVLTGITSSCKYDDDEIWDSVDNLADRVAALESLTKQMNSDIAAMQSIITALEKNVSVSHVEELADGYIIHFTDGTKATIKNGKDGADGQNGADGLNGKDGLNAPIIGVAQLDGVYYWTITKDGVTEWLTDDAGNKFSVTSEDGEDGTDGTPGKDGENGVTPLVKVEDDVWKVSYDNGTTWESLEVSPIKGPQGDRGDSTFADEPIEIVDGMVIITMADGTIFEIPAAAAVVYNGGAFNANVVNALTEEITLSYSVTNMSNVSIEILKQENVKAVADENAMTITITPAGTGNGKVVILFYNNNQTITSVLNFTM